MGGGCVQGLLTCFFGGGCFVGSFKTKYEVKDVDAHVMKVL